MMNLASESAAFPVRWKCVARAPEEMAAARDRWESGQRFVKVTAHDGERRPAPHLGRDLEVVGVYSDHTRNALRR